MKTLRLLLVMLIVSSAAFAQGDINLDKARQVIAQKWLVKSAVKDGEDKIEVTSKVTYDFHADGTVTFYHTEMDEAIKGTWELSTVSNYTVLSLYDDKEDTEDQLLRVVAINYKEMTLSPIDQENGGYGDGTLVLYAEGAK